MADLDNFSTRGYPSQFSISQTRAVIEVNQPNNNNATTVVQLPTNPSQEIRNNGIQLKMNSIGVAQDMPGRVGEMYALLLGISEELTNIKQIMDNQNCYNGTGDDTVDDGRDDIVDVGRDDTVDDGRDDTVDGKPCFQYEEYKSTDSAFEINQDSQSVNQQHDQLDGEPCTSPGENWADFIPMCRDRESFSSIGINNMSGLRCCRHSLDVSNPHSMAAALLSKRCREDSVVSPGLQPPSPFLIIANKILKGPVVLNVGGKKCVGLQELCDAYSLDKREYYFDRSPRNFDAILGLYRTGKLHLSQGVCVQDFCEELEYWGLTDLHLEPCCQHTYYRARWLLPQTGLPGDDQDEEFGNGLFSSSQRRLWNLFENPHHSGAAKIVAVVSCLFVVVSTLCLIFSTLPKFQQKDSRGVVQEEYFFEVAEAVFVGWFTFEYVVRFIAAPKKIKFIKGGMNIVDLLGILPYFMSLFLNLVTTTSNTQNKYQDEMRRIAQIFRIMRILRIFKLARHITGLQTLGMTLKNSYKELGLLMLVVIMGMLIFSGLAYVSEKDEQDTEFISMPQALYWAIITMTSVGYGDITPKTWFGKLVGSACAICGVLCISLPIPIIVNNFNKFYEKAKIEEEILSKKKKASWEDAKRGVFQNIHDSFDEIDSSGLVPYTVQSENVSRFQTIMARRRKRLRRRSLGFLPDKPRRMDPNLKQNRKRGRGISCFGISLISSPDTEILPFGQTKGNSQYNFSLQSDSETQTTVDEQSAGQWIIEKQINSDKITLNNVSHHIINFEENYEPHELISLSNIDPFTNLDGNLTQENEREEVERRCMKCNCSQPS
ncbi:uncharacterized protein LOC111698406 [Eurytemora carolleeae]|uniref:uncharacterized protein LOC111698406 n=1 Tax=Eurytemora carolleeae TaxID=1294199 RepID=UPI000C75A665|nr:uncharacterized protein LOC111698406 [Eurytemora carolleeae]|eukprot:XP_023324508.1 uncharacterized protein LOC111698406 [Eurytemora affinis]